jgi:hypothetical protein
MSGDALGVGTSHVAKDGTVILWTSLRKLLLATRRRS